MQLAITEAKTGIENGDGGPFGAVIVKNGDIIASSHNCVLKNCDSTCPKPSTNLFYAFALLWFQLISSQFGEQAGMTNKQMLYELLRKYSFIGAVEA